MQVLVNGETREVPPGTTVLGLIDLLGLRPERVAVERNRDLVLRRAFGETRLEAGDRLEVVTFVGGG